MGRKAEKARRLAAKAKKQAGQDSCEPSAPAAAPAAPLPASPPASPPETPVIPAGTGTNADAHTTANTRTEPAKKKGPRPRIVTSDRTMRPRAIGNATMGTSQETTTPGPFEPQEISTGRVGDASDKSRPHRKSSEVVKTLLQQMNTDGDSIDSSELEGECNDEDNQDNDG